MEELIAHIDRRLDELTANIDRRFEQVDRRFEQVDRRFEQVDRRFEQVNERLDKTENEIRKTQVWVEKLDDDIRAVAEGVVSVRQELEDYKVENAKEHEATRSALRFSHGQLHRRQDELDGRVAALEAGAH